MNIKLPLQTVFSLIFGRKFLLHIFFLTASFSVFGQNFTEDFGTGPDVYTMAPATTTYTVPGDLTHCPPGRPDDGKFMITCNCVCPATCGGCTADGYRFFNGWHQGLKDHTNGTNGRFLLVNAAAATGEFYRRDITGLISGNSYNFSAWVANILNATTGCTPASPVNVNFEIYNGATKIQELSTGNITAQSSLSGIWKEYGITFTAPASTLTLVMRNAAPGGCGNDLAIDDISFITCTAGTQTVNAGNDITQCQSTTTATLTATGSTTGGTWTRVSGSGNITSPNSASTGITGLTLGTSVFRYSVPAQNNGCIPATDDDVSITLSAVATPSFTYTATCDGGTPANITPAGGTFALTSNPSGAASINTSTGVITGGTPGVAYAATYTVGGACGGTSSAVPVTVLAKDNPAFTMSATCNAATATITGTTGGTFSFTAPAPTDGATINASTGAISNASSGTQYSVRYTTAGACPDSSVVNITTSASVTAVAGKDGDLTCSKTTATLNSTGSSTGANIRYTWTASAGGALSGATNTATATATAAGTYTLLVEDIVSGCSNSTTVIVNSNTTNPTVAFPQPTNLTCGSPTTQLSSTGSSSGASFTYAWSASNGGSISGATNGTTATASAAGTYRLTITNTTTGCTDFLERTVTSDGNTPSVSIVQPNPLTCTTTTLTLNATASTPVPSASVTYAWTASNGGVIDSGANTASPTISATGTYTLVITNTANGCSNSGNVIVTDNLATPTVVLSNPAQLSCTVNSTSIASTGSSSGTDYTYLWTATNGGNVPASQNSAATLTVTQVGTYTLRITDNRNGCIIEDSRQVTSNANDPIARIAAPQQLSCTNNTVTLNGTTSTTTDPANTIYQWTTVGGNIVSGQGTSVIIVNQPGDYTLTLTNIVNNCSNSTTRTVSEDKVLPTINIAVPQDITCTRPTVTLDGSLSSGGNSMTYLWTASNGGVIDSGADTRTPVVSAGGSYVLTITNTATGCTDTRTVQVTDTSTRPVVANATHAQCSTGTIDKSIFVLNQRDNSITGGLSGLATSYHLTQAEAENNTGALNKNSYTNATNPQILYVRASDSQGCVSIAELELVVNNGPAVNTTPDTLLYCDPNSDGFGVFTLTEADADILQGATGVTLTYHETNADAIANIKPIGPTYNNRNSYTQTIYARATDATTGCYTLVNLPLQVNDTPRATTPKTYALCDDNADGIVAFNLPSRNAEIRGSLSSNQHTITYYVTEADANAKSNAIANETNYSNTTSPQTVWARIEHNSTGCYRAIPLILRVDPLPIASEPSLYPLCDANNPGDKKEVFNLNTKINEIIGTQAGLQVSFHATQNDADNKLRAIANPTTYTNVVVGAVETLFVRVENPDTKCYATTLLDLRVDPLPSPRVPAKPLEVCDPDADGFESFDLESLTQGIRDNDPNLNITYHETQANANLGVLALTSPYKNIRNARTGITIYARAQHQVTGCWTTIPVQLIANPSPQVPVELDDIKICDEPSLIDGSTNNDGFAFFDLTQHESKIYGTQSKTQNSLTYHRTQLEAVSGINPIANPKNYRNEVVNQETIWASLRNTTTDCSREVSFNIIVNPLPVIVAPTRLDLCEDKIKDEKTEFDLTLKVDEILNNQLGYEVRFYTLESDAIAGNTRYVVDPTKFTNTVNPQTLYVRVNDKVSGCWQRTKLTVRVQPNPSPETPEPLETCDANATGDGIEVFDLTQRNVSVENAEGGVTLRYYPTQVDAEEDTNEITTPTAYTNTQRDEDKVYVRVEDDLTGCKSVVELKLIVRPMPEPNNLPPAIECAINTTASYPFELEKDHTPIILKDMVRPQDYKVSYYATQVAAENAVTGTQLNTPYLNKSNPEVVWARIEHKEYGCFVVGSFELQVREEVLVNRPKTALAACGIQTGNLRTATFDLTTKESEILGSLTPSDYTISYYENYNATTKVTSNPIAIPTAYQNTRNNQVVYAEVVRNDGTACTSVVDFTLQVNLNPIPVLDEEYIICVDPETNQLISGGEKILNSGLLAATHTFEWLLNGTVIPDATDSVYTAVEPGEYQVIATHKGTGCSSIPPAVTNVVASSYPTIESAQSISSSFSSNHTIQIIATGRGTYEYSLEGSPYQESGIFENVKPGVYTYTVRDVNGCLDPISNVVFAADYMRFFTPNGDGMNDEWNIIGLSEEAKARILIFDRYGKLLKEIRPEGKGWDGTFNGYSLPANDYWFVVEYQENGQQKEFKSHFTLKR